MQEGNQNNATNCLNERIKQFREYLGHKQDEVAEKSGFKRQTISTYEMGTREPSSKYIMWLANQGMNVHWLYTGEGEMLTSATMQGDRINSIAEAVNEADEILNRLKQAKEAGKAIFPLTVDLELELLELLRANALHRRK